VLLKPRKLKRLPDEMMQVCIFQQLKSLNSFFLTNTRHPFLEKSRDGNGFTFGETNGNEAREGLALAI
jgi:hypothetical protein